MPTSVLQPDKPRDLVLSVSGLEPDEVYALRDWFCYTKPLGPSIRVVTHASTGQAGFCVVASGNEPGADETSEVASE
jgi:hypothetical protein